MQFTIALRILMSSYIASPIQNKRANYIQLMYHSEYHIREKIVAKREEEGIVMRVGYEKNAREL